jgi:hypothetical protein
MSAAAVVHLGRVTQDDVNQIIHRLHTGGAVDTCPECCQVTDTPEGRTRLPARSAGPPTKGAVHGKSSRF